MKITIIRIGKTKEKYVTEAENEYLKRLKAFATVEIRELKEVQLKKGEAQAGREEVKQEEAAQIVRILPKGAYVIALDEHGKELDSVQFGQTLGKIRDFEGGHACFVIGGCYGLGKEILQKADMVLSFSKLTFTHELIRVLLLEQIYRGFTILAGKTYHY